MKDIEEIISIKISVPEKHITRPEKIEGIYFLFYKNEIIYIGKSINIYKRIYAHKMKGVCFDSFSFLKIEIEQLLTMEREYIKKYNPKNNIHFTGKPINKKNNDTGFVTITAQLEDEQHEFLKSFSLEKTGKENINSAIRLLIKERQSNKCKCS